MAKLTQLSKPYICPLQENHENQVSEIWEYWIVKWCTFSCNFIWMTGTELMFSSMQLGIVSRYLGMYLSWETSLVKGEVTAPVHQLTECVNIVSFEKPLSEYRAQTEYSKRTWVHVEWDTVWGYFYNITELVYLNNVV